MDKTTKYFAKTNGKTDKNRTKKLEEMNRVFEATLVSESYPGVIKTYNDARRKRRNWTVQGRR
jgi:hypothetical protein